MRAGIAVLGSALVIAGCASSAPSPPAHPASADATVTDCSVDPSSSDVVIGGTVHNNSSKTSNYVVSAEASYQGTRIASGFASVLEVAAGEDRSFTIHPVSVNVPDIGVPISCSVTKVSRSAS